MRILFHTLTSLAVLTMVAPLCYWGVIQLGTAPIEGVSIGEQTPSADGLVQQLEQRADEWLDTGITIETAGMSRSISRRELGAEVDVTLARQRAQSVGRSGNPITDLSEIMRARRDGIDVAWRPSFDEHQLTEVAHELATLADRDPVGGELNIAERHLRHPRWGVRLDVERTERALSTLLEGNALSVKIPALLIPPTDGVPIPKGLNLDHVLATYDTTFHRYGDYLGRAHNVRLAASRLHGAVIAPGETLSFNEQVGERRARAGYRMAPVIIRGQIEEDIGGGVCQVASTLHAAAFYGGLDLVEYVPHSRPSSYIPMGLDATVVWPEVDLRIRNPYEFPIAVRSVVVENELTVELLGPRVPAEVELARDFVDTRSFTNRTVVDPTLAAGATVVSQGGIRGFTVRRVRRVREGDTFRVEDRILEYPPTDRIVRVGP